MFFSLRRLIRIEQEVLRTQAVAREIKDLLITLQRSFDMSTSTTDQNFANLQAQVAATTTVEQSAVTLINGLAEQLAAAISASNNGDSAALPALQQQLQTSAASLAAAVTANTPATGTSTNTSTST